MRTIIIRKDEVEEEQQVAEKEKPSRHGNMNVRKKKTIMIASDKNELKTNDNIQVQETDDG